MPVPSTTAATSGAAGATMIAPLTTTARRSGSTRRTRATTTTAAMLGTPGATTIAPLQTTLQQFDSTRKTPPTTTTAATRGSPRVISLVPSPMQTRRDGLAAIIRIEQANMHKQRPVYTQYQPFRVTSPVRG